MKNLKSAILTLLICAGTFAACSDNQFSPISGETSANFSKDDNDTALPEFERVIYLKPGQTGEFTSKDFRFKTFSSLEIKNLSNYGNISCNEIGISLTPYPERKEGYFGVCLSHQEIYVVGNLTASRNVKVQNLSDKTVELKLYVR